MSEVVASFLRHVLVCGVGVGLVALLAFAIRLVVARDAVLRYRVMVAALLAGAALVPLQVWTAETTHATVPSGTPSAPLAVATTEPVVLKIDSGATPDVGGTLAPVAAPRATRSVREADAALLLLGAYGLVAAIILGLHVRGGIAASRLIARARVVRDARILAVWEPLVREMKAPPLLLESDDLRAPACRVLGRPAVILPASIVAHDDATLVASLRHELVHIARRDGAVVLLAAAAKVCLWFQPLVWVFARVLDSDREQSCDALVVRETGRARSYAEALLCFCETGSRGRAVTPLIGFESSHSVRRRITMLSHSLRPATRVRRIMLLAAGVTGAVTAIAAHGAVTKMVAPGAILTKGEGSVPRASIEVRAPEEGRSTQRVYERVIALQHANEQAGGPGGLVLSKPTSEEWLVSALSGKEWTPAYPEGTWVTDEEPVLVAKEVTLKGDLLLSKTLRVRLPGGSKLRAAFEGTVVKIERAEGQKDRVLITDGSVTIMDEQGVKRAVIRSDRTDGTIVWTNVGGDEAAEFEVTTEDPAGSLSARIDMTTGVPAGESQAPHGAVRWRMVLPRCTGGVTDFRMQWNYDVSKVPNPVGC
ncbi:MAG: M56 family metallopeptidase [Phycisphaerales bacterium]